MAGFHWDVFCRAIDNHGDVGVCWRLAADLASRGETVRLWVDDPSALVWMAPSGAPRVSVDDWRGATVDPGDVVVEAFGCDPPAGFVRRMAARPRPPVWLNLEYLSAEAYVRLSHALPSPQLAGPGAGLTKWFFYPGFSDGTGGLLREPRLGSQQRAFDATAWLKALGVPTSPDEQRISLFCYDNEALQDLLQSLAGASRPTLLLCAPGQAWTQVDALLGPGRCRGALRARPLPFLSQADYDRLLWSCDVNFVRGEDSFVRAQWAGAPFVWQAYRQSDDWHGVKLRAFLDAHLTGATEPLSQALRAVHARWNGLGSPAWEWPEPVAWRRHAAAWRDSLLKQDDLVSQMLRFVAERR